MTAREILKQMLADVSDDYDKSDGSFIFNALMPVAERLAKTDGDINAAIGKMNISHLTGDELAQRVKERTGIDRRQASRSIGTVTVTGTGVINKGDRFETNDGTQFRAVESKTITVGGNVRIEAVVPGAIGNVASNTIVMFPVTLGGFTAVTNTQPTYDGFDAESDVDLLVRYFDRIQTPSTSGNKNQFRNWAKEVQGVGDARVIPLWAGDNTVKIIIIDSSRQPASQDLVEAVQEYIDPGSSGLGLGVSPIGAFTTVESAAAVDINVSANVTLAEGQSLQQAIDDFSIALTNHLTNIAFASDFVSYAQVGSVLLSTKSVVDYTNLHINGGTNNINIANDEVAVMGVITLND